ncbi:MAG: transposase [Acidobacteriota bacterium]
MKLDLPVPDHSTLTAQGQLTISLPIKDWSKSRHLVVDSTGVKVYGEGEWKVRQHGISKRRTWRKLHFCTDQATLEIISVVASTNDVSDAGSSSQILLSRTRRAKSKTASADGLYDRSVATIIVINQHGAKAAIPLRKGAKIWQHKHKGRTACA